MNSGGKLIASVRHHTTPILLVLPLLILTLLVDRLGGVVTQRIVIVMFVNLSLVVALQMFMGNSGVASFAHVGFMGIGAYGSAVFSMTPQAKAIALRNLYPVLREVQVPFIVALLIGAGIATLIAAVVGFPLMRLSGAASVIATFALLIIIHVVLVNWSEVTNGPRTLFGLPNYTTLWNSAVWAISFILLAYVFKETSLGLKLRASREEEQAAASIGINVVIVRWVAFFLSAFVAGVAGALWAHFITSFSPQAFYLTQTFLIITMLIVGGKNSVTGAVVGTVAVTAIFEGLRSVENAINLSATLPFTVSGLTEMFLAIALIVILIFWPAGITSGREIRWPGIKKRPRAQPIPVEHS
ncbi:MAG: branched-chain amino acid ABC transporter permease [Chloroflexi bacterium]|nr:MAG: branched-chain amino acid ABC transporter permease [Chloroflexota bacterium]